MRDQTSKVGGRFAVGVVAPGLTWVAAAGADPLFFVTPPEIGGGDVAMLVRLAATKWAGRSKVRTAGKERTVTHEVTVIVRRIPVDLDALAETFREEGFTVYSSGTQYGWLTVRRGNTGTVHLGVLDAFGKACNGMFKAADKSFADSKTIARRLAAFAGHTDAAWMGKNAGITGGELLRRRYRARPNDAWRQIEWRQGPKDNEVDQGVRLLSGWARRPLSEVELKSRHVHRFDIRLMFLNAFAGVKVGYKVPKHAGAIPFSRSRAGSWLVPVGEIVDVDTQLRKAGRPGLVPMLSTLLGGPDVVKQKRTWLTTPVMALLEDLGVLLAPEAAVVSPEGDSRQLYQPWAQALRDAVRAAEQDPDTTIRAAVKEIANAFRGMLVKDAGDRWRIDHSNLVVDHARAMLLRRVIKSGYDPALYDVDSFWIVTDDAPDVVAAALGAPFKSARADQEWTMGAPRYEGTTTVAEFIETYGRGGNL